MKFLFLFICLLPLTISAQQQMESNLNTAYQNAKKGIYWALANIPENKSRIQSDLIAEEKLYASVKLEKEYEGVKIVSIGYHNTTEISIVVYRSNEGLIKEGYIKQEPPDSLSTE
jgi:hypothetical protein